MPWHACTALPTKARVLGSSTPLFSPNNPFLLAFAHLTFALLSHSHCCLVRTVGIRTSGFALVSFALLSFALLSGYPTCTQVGCHAVARADRRQKSMQKHCRDHGKRLVCRSESSASSFNFFSKPLVLTRG